jgi:hypothetical protein
LLFLVGSSMGYARQFFQLYGQLRVKAFDEGTVEGIKVRFETGIKRWNNWRNRVWSICMTGHLNCWVIYTIAYGWRDKPRHVEIWLLNCWLRRSCLSSTVTRNIYYAKQNQLIIMLHTVATIHVMLWNWDFFLDWIFVRIEGIFLVIES